MPATGGANNGGGVPITGSTHMHNQYFKTIFKPYPCLTFFPFSLTPSQTLCNAATPYFDVNNPSVINSPSFDNKITSYAAFLFYFFILLLVYSEQFELVCLFELSELSTAILVIIKII